MWPCVVPCSTCILQCIFWYKWKMIVPEVTWDINHASRPCFRQKSVTLFSAYFNRSLLLCSFCILLIQCRVIPFNLHIQPKAGEYYLVPEQVLTTYWFFGQRCAKAVRKLGGALYHQGYVILQYLRQPFSEWRYNGCTNLCHHHNATLSDSQFKQIKCQIIAYLCSLIDDTRIRRDRYSSQHW